MFDEKSPKQAKPRNGIFGFYALYNCFMHFTTAHNNCFALLLIQLQVDMQQDHLFLLLFACRDALANSVEKMLHRKIIPVLEM